MLNCVSNGAVFDASNAFSTPYPNVTGLLTRTGVRNLETGAWYSSAMWYDDKARIIQQQSQNYLQGLDLTNMQYGFSGEVMRKEVFDDAVAYNYGFYSAESYAYDHLSRPVSVSYTPSDEPFEMARYRYDALGRLSQKVIQPNGSVAGTGGGSSITRTANPPTGTTLDQAPDFIDILPDNFDINHQNNASGLYEAKIGPAVGGSTGALQTLDYRYHLRGWLRGLNVDATGQPVLNSSRGDVFGFGLDYETAGYFDGNIGRQRWLGSRQPGQLRQYTYSYDAASRLSGATYAGASGENYNLSGMSYDPNGNIQSLNRAGIDQLSYTYAEGNKLRSVGDASGNPAGFADGNTSGDDYAYWPDGSLKKDLNRGITDIQYNLLKLPRQLSFSTGQVVSYTYTATGQKLRMSSSSGEVRDYLTQGQCRNGQFEYQHTPEGRVIAGGYEYFHQDHLGNIRAVYRDSSGVATLSQRVDYDPWGLELAGLSYQGSANPNRLKFNGKEVLAELGSGLVDYGARLYDATNGRWGVVDPLAELSRRFSPFVYGDNNPVRMIDPDGMEAQDLATCPTCPKGAEYDQYRDSQALFTYDTKAGLVLNGDGMGPTVYGQRNNQFPSPFFDTSPTLSADSNSPHLSARGYRPQPTGEMQLEGFLNNANSNHGRAGAVLSTAEIALKQTANGLRSIGQFTTAYHARLANAAAIGKIASKLGVIGLGVNALLIGAKIQNGTLKPSDVAGLAIGIALTTAAVFNPVGAAAITIAVAGIAYTALDESGALEGAKQYFDNKFEK